MERGKCLICLKEFTLGEDDLIKTQLQVIFLLRKILEIPEEKCCNFLQDYGDPGSWINCCNFCSVLVEKAKCVFDMLTQLKKQYENLQNEIKNTISKSAKNKDNDYTGGLRDIIRFHVHQERPDSPDKFICATSEVKVEEDISYPHLKTIPETNCPSFHYGDVELVKNPIIEEDNLYQINDLYETVKIELEERDPLSLDETESLSCFVDPYDAQKVTVADYSDDIGKGLETKEEINEKSNLRLDSSFRRKLSTSSVISAGRVSKEVNSSSVLHKKSFTAHKYRNLLPYQKDILHKCDICFEGFGNSNLFKIHLKNHTGEKPYECDECGKLFALNKNLRLHGLCHKPQDEIYKYKCEYCSKTFKENCNLKTHRRIHTGEKPYTCDYCKKAFGHHSSLKHHIRIHTGEKPFECALCGKCFTRQGILKAHLRSHAIKPVKIINLG